MEATNLDSGDPERAALAAPWGAMVHYLDHYIEALEGGTIFDRRLTEEWHKLRRMAENFPG
jgi:hypothetical protein